MTDTDLEHALRANFAEAAREAPAWTGPDAGGGTAAYAEATKAPRSWARVSLAAAAAVVAVVGTAAVVENTLAGPSPSTAPATAPQQDEPSEAPDDALQLRLQSIAEHYSAFEDADGYGKTVIDAGAREIRVFWHGEVPAEVRDLSLRDSEDGVTVQLVAAKYSDAQLQAAANVVWKATGAPDGLDVVATYPSPDMSALVVEVAAGDEARAQAQLDSQVGDLGIPLDVIVTGGVVPR